MMHDQKIKGREFVRLNLNDNLMKRMPMMLISSKVRVRSDVTAEMRMFQW